MSWQPGTPIDMSGVGSLGNTAFADPSWMNLGAPNTNLNPALPQNWGSQFNGATGTIDYGAGPGIMPGTTGGFFGNGQGLGFNMPTAQLAIGGLQTLAGIWGGLQNLKLAKKQFNFTRDITETNLANQMKTYNTALADRARSRGAMEGQSQSQVDQYVQDNSLRRSNGG